MATDEGGRAGAEAASACSRGEEQSTARISSRPGAASRPGRPPLPGAEPLPEIPPPVAELLADLWNAGQAAYVVGGCLRDALLEREPSDWDLTTDAAPERIQSIFPGSLYENRFGTVVVRRGDAQYEITAFRRDVSYSDHRHPDAVQFGESIDEDLARRDFTVNAMAWGGRAGEGAAFVDPFDGRADLRRGVLRAVGDPGARFREDALRMVRAARLAAALDFRVEPATLDAVRDNASLARHLSGERVAAELLKLLAAPRPSIGLRLMADTGLLEAVLPELARQAGIGQNKIEGEDLWDHTLRTVDAAPNRPLVRLAALLHDIAKPDTYAEGHFHGHDVVGADQARVVLERLHAPRALQERVAHLVRQHMFSFEPNWSDAAVRRFIQRVGPGSIDDLLALRAADNVGSGLGPEAGRLAELARRAHAQLEAHVALSRADLALDGNDLMAELGLPASPALGRLLESLTERVISEPALNDRAILLELARTQLAQATDVSGTERAAAQRRGDRDETKDEAG